MLEYAFRRLVLVLVVLLSACTNEPRTPEAVVAERAQARWDALIKGDLETAYGYLSPGFRQATPFERYQRRIHGVGKWQRAQVQKVDCDQPDVCRVTVELDMRIMVPRAGGPIDSTGPVYERWIQVDSDWWYVPER